MKLRLFPPSATWIRRSLYCLAFGFAAALLFGGICRAQHEQHGPATAAPSIGNPAGLFELTSLDGKPLRLAAFRGQPLVINFFATWCDPCREEMPLINDLAKHGAKSGYRVIGIAVEDGRAAVTAYAQEARLVFPIALDLNSTVKRAYRIFGPPATFFIDGEGVIRDLVLGPLSEERSRLALKKIGAEAP